MSQTILANVANAAMEMNGSSAGPSKPRQDLSPSHPNHPPGAVPRVPFHASIRFSSTALADLEITIPDINDSPPPTVLSIKQQIRFLRPDETHNRRLRLILAGKVMSDLTPLRQIHSQLTRRPSVSPVAASPKGKEKEVVVDRVWIHCSIGEQLSKEEFEEEGGENQTQSTLPLPVGFDRLRNAGFSDEDIASLRAQFQRFHGSREEEDEAVDVTAMEERWLDETIGLGGGTSTADGGASDSYEETLIGFIIGYFAGIFALFFIWEPSMGISRNLKQAIIAGLSVNVIIGCVKSLN